MEDTSTSKRPRLDSHDCSYIRQELFRAAEVLQDEFDFEQVCYSFLRHKAALDQALREGVKELEEKNMYVSESQTHPEARTAEAAHSSETTLPIDKEDCKNLMGATSSNIIEA